MGIASGVKAISFRCCASVSAFLLIPRFLVNFLKVVKNPSYNNNSTRNTQCINTDSEKQDVLSYKKDTIRIINTFIAVHNEILERSFWCHFALGPQK
jgi:hypothetical protein